MKKINFANKKTLLALTFISVFTITFYLYVSTTHAGTYNPNFDCNKKCTDNKFNGGACTIISTLADCTKQGEKKINDPSLCSSPYSCCCSGGQAGECGNGECETGEMEKCSQGDDKCCQDCLYKCIDSDNGDSPTIAGTCTYVGKDSSGKISSKSGSDTCLSKSTLKEFVCEGVKCISISNYCNSDCVMLGYESGECPTGGKACQCKTDGDTGKPDCGLFCAPNTKTCTGAAGVECSADSYYCDKKLKCYSDQDKCKNDCGFLDCQIEGQECNDNDKKCCTPGYQCKEKECVADKPSCGAAGGKCEPSQGTCDIYCGSKRGVLKDGYDCDSIPWDCCLCESNVHCTTENQEANCAGYNSAGGCVAGVCEIPQGSTQGNCIAQNQPSGTPCEGGKGTCDGNGKCQAPKSCTGIDEFSAKGWCEKSCKPKGYKYIYCKCDGGKTVCNLDFYYCSNNPQNEGWPTYSCTESSVQCTKASEEVNCAGYNSQDKCVIGVCNDAGNCIAQNQPKNTECDLPDGANGICDGNGKCGEKPTEQCTEDQTPVGQCSSQNKGKYCNENKQLIDACGAEHNCGCPDETYECKSNGKCEKVCECESKECTAGCTNAGDSCLGSSNCKKCANKDEACGWLGGGKKCCEGNCEPWYWPTCKSEPLTPQSCKKEIERCGGDDECCQESQKLKCVSYTCVDPKKLYCEGNSEGKGVSLRYGSVKFLDCAYCCQGSDDCGELSACCSNTNCKSLTSQSCESQPDLKCMPNPCSTYDQSEGRWCWYILDYSCPVLSDWCCSGPCVRS